MPALHSFLLVVNVHFQNPHELNLAHAHFRHAVDSPDSSQHLEEPARRSQPSVRRRTNFEYAVAAIVHEFD